MSRRWPQMRTRWPQLCALALVTGMLAAPSRPASSGPYHPAVPSTSQPSILVILSDDQSWSTFNRALMPGVFSQLVDRGVLFNRAYVNTALCCPSRSQILTGLYEHHTGVDENPVSLDRPTIVSALHDVGYRTGLFGKYLNSWPCAPRPEFDEWYCFDFKQSPTVFTEPRMNENGTWVDEHGYTADVEGRFAGSFIQSTPPDQPFFALYAPPNPHLPANDPRCTDDPVDPYRPPSYDEDTTSGGKPGYMQRQPFTPQEIAHGDGDFAAMTQAVECLDPAVSSLLGSLGGREQDTIVFYLSDNGFLYGEHRRTDKRVPYEEATRVPFIVRYPPLVPEAQPFTSDALVENVDIAPTIADLAGIPWGADGLSLTPLLSGSVSTIRDAALIETCQGERYPCEGGFVADQTAPPSFFAVDTAQYQYVEYVTGEVELYDLVADPYEIVNHAEDPEYAQVQSDLAGRMAALHAPPPVDTTVVTGPHGSVQPGTYTFVYFSQSRFATYQCRLDVNWVEGPWEPCDGQSFQVGPLEPGSYTFNVEGTDEFGSADPAPAVRSFDIVDTAGPTMIFDQAPPAFTASADATFVFHPDEPAAGSFMCALDGGVAEDCSGGAFGATNLVEGPHSLAIAATDILGNPGSTTYSWTVDLTSPVLTMTGGPAPYTSLTTVRFTFDSSEPPGGFDCALDDAPATACSSPATYSGLPEGPHVFAANARDGAGNVSESVVANWTQDAVKPIVTIVLGPLKVTKNATPSFTLSSNEPGTYQCSADGARFSACATPDIVSGLADGLHTFKARAVDLASNTSSAAIRTWTQDTRPPVAVLTSTPPASTTTTTATFTFSSDEGGSTFACTLDTKKASACVSGVTYSNLRTGKHTFKLAAADKVGNHSATVSWVWRITTVGSTDLGQLRD